MIGFLPRFRFPRRHGRPDPRAQRGRGRSVTVQPPTDMVSPAQWSHGPSEPFYPAETCGVCGEPVGKYPDGETCSAKCAAAWLSALPVPERNQDPFIAPDITPEPPPEPAWMARFSAWQRAKAAALVAERKSPNGEVAA